MGTSSTVPLSCHQGEETCMKTFGRWGHQKPFRPRSGGAPEPIGLPCRVLTCPGDRGCVTAAILAAALRARLPGPATQVMEGCGFVFLGKSLFFRRVHLLGWKTEVRLRKGPCTLPVECWERGEVPPVPRPSSEPGCRSLTFSSRSQDGRQGRRGALPGPRGRQGSHRGPGAAAAPWETRPRRPGTAVRPGTPGLPSWAGRAVLVPGPFPRAQPPQAQPLFGFGVNPRAQGSASP